MYPASSLLYPLVGNADQWALKSITIPVHHLSDWLYKHAGAHTQANTTLGEKGPEKNLFQVSDGP